MLAYLGVLFTTFLASHRKAKSHWQLNRSAAEFIKSNCWRYAVHGAPFDSATEHPEALFANRLEDGLQELRKVGWADPREELMDSGGLITESMRALRGKAYTVRKETYVRDGSSSSGAGTAGVSTPPGAGRCCGRAPSSR